MATLLQTLSKIVHKNFTEVRANIVMTVMLLLVLSFNYNLTYSGV